ncbi:lipopolysaccharide biosynthesis protein [Catellatospora sp. KI3]|uniref:lipopolysaccharide biosynthesis protein n=1 Tax=Catellatospora sp. KI3 TaxID=3041620 RepID=UPI0024825B1C|nr:lipopolysaccharide biosynthesis protein [Catellatospora sp. KI3]MDI1460386.1 lipopolysaccharide biosynthesis protein [Catellatospora sp. KI3]
MEATYAGSPPSSYDMSDYLGLLRRHWWIAVVLTALGVAAGAAYNQSLPREYVSAASVLVRPAGLDANVSGGRTRDEINLDTEAQLLRSTPVVAGAAKLLNRQDVDVLGASVSVEVPPNTSVLQVEYTAGDPLEAQAGAHAFAQSYLANREGNAKAELTRQADALRAKLKELSDDLTDINGKLSGLHSNSSAYASLDSQRDTTVNQINQLNNRVNALATETVNAGVIIQEARVPSRPVKPNPAVNYAAGALLGLLAGLGLAALRQRLDRRVHGGRDLVRAGIDVLGTVSGKGKSCTEVFTPFSPGGRAFNRLRNEVVAALKPGEQVVVVTGASRGPAATLVAANLAAALSRTGAEVVLIGAQVPDTLAESAPLAQLLGVAPTPGLSDLLAGRVNLAEATQRAARTPSLHVITTGGTATAAGMLQSHALRDIVATLRAHADYLVIEAPSTAASADAQSLASLADAAIVAVELRRTRRPQLSDAAEQLRRVGTVLLGGVVMPKLAHRARRKPAATPEPALVETAAPEPDPHTNGHKPRGEDQTIMLAPVDASELAELDEAHPR